LAGKKTVKEHNRNAGTEQQPEAVSGTGQPDRQAGLARNSREVVSSAGASQGEKPSDQRDAVMDPPGSTGLLDLPKAKPKAKPSFYEAQYTGADSPFLKALGDSMLLPIYQRANDVLIKEDQERRQRAIETTRQWEQAHPEATKKKWRDSKRRQRERKKQEAQSH
jgi:hypothetical protein